jgi:dTDP-glucose 4,6-dehydratase
MITNLIADKKLLIYGDGKYVRDWLYVEDHCRAIEKVIKKGKPGETYLVGGLTKDINNIHVAKKLLKIFGKDKKYLKFVKDRPGHDRRYAVDWRKIKKLGWKPGYGFEEWLKKTVDWYKENAWWWLPLKKKAEKLYKATGQI